MTTVMQIESSLVQETKVRPVQRSPSTNLHNTRCQSTVILVDLVIQPVYAHGDDLILKSVKRALSCIHFIEKSAISLLLLQHSETHVCSSCTYIVLHHPQMPRHWSPLCSRVHSVILSFSHLVLPATFSGKPSELLKFQL